MATKTRKVFLTKEYIICDWCRKELEEPRTFNGHQTYTSIGKYHIHNECIDAAVIAGIESKQTAGSIINFRNPNKSI